MLLTRVRCDGEVCKKAIDATLHNDILSEIQSELIKQLAMRAYFDAFVLKIRLRRCRTSPHASDPAPCQQLKQLPEKFVPVRFSIVFSHRRSSLASLTLNYPSDESKEKRPSCERRLLAPPLPVSERDVFLELRTFNRRLFGFLRGFFRPFLLVQELHATCDDLRCVPLHAFLVGPIAGPQGSFDVHE